MYQMSRMYARILKKFPASFLSLVSAKIMIAASRVFVGLHTYISKTVLSFFLEILIKIPKFVLNLL